jgi:hypothetical protein
MVATSLPCTDGSCELGLTCVRRLVHCVCTLALGHHRVCAGQRLAHPLLADAYCGASLCDLLREFLAEFCQSRCEVLAVLDKSLPAVTTRTRSCRVFMRGCFIQLPIQVWGKILRVHTHTHTHTYIPRCSANCDVGLDCLRLAWLISSGNCLQGKIQFGGWNQGAGVSESSGGITCSRFALTCWRFSLTASCILFGAVWRCILTLRDASCTFRRRSSTRAFSTRSSGSSRSGKSKYTQHHAVLCELPSLNFT